MPLPPITAIPLKFPPGRVGVRLAPEHRDAYRALYGRFGTLTDGLPVLRDRDFDGRRVTMTRPQFEALSAAFARLDTPPKPRLDEPFELQERSKTRLFKRLQHLS